MSLNFTAGQGDDQGKKFSPVLNFSMKHHGFFSPFNNVSFSPLSYLLSFSHSPFLSLSFPLTLQLLSLPSTSPALLRMAAKWCHLCSHTARLMDQFTSALTSTPQTLVDYTIHICGILALNVLHSVLSHLICSSFFFHLLSQSLLLHHTPCLSIRQFPNLFLTLSRRNVSCHLLL